MSRKTLLIFLYIYALIFSVLKTIRLPNQWSVAHWMVDYRFGFIKRGFAGEILGFFAEKNEMAILLVSVTILLLLYGILIGIAVKKTMEKPDDMNRIFFYSVFFMSQYMVFSAHLIGYLDHLIFLLTIAAVYLIRKGKILLPSALLSVGILIHEISFFLMFPICLFALVVKETPHQSFSLKEMERRRLLQSTVLLLVVPVCILAGIIGYQQWYGENHYNNLLNYLTQTGLIRKSVASLVSTSYTESFTSFLAEESPHFLQRVFVSTCTVIYGIPMLFMGFMIYKEFSKAGLLIVGLLGAVSLFPLLLHAIAWDTYRIWAFPFMIMFLGFWILGSQLKPELPLVSISKFEIIFFITSVLLVSLIPNFLFDGETERFSLRERLLIILPIFLTIYYLFKKSGQSYK
ncbi:hypothetical protein [Chryseobacterium sp. CT-SW4]|uniref:hypothetical protein n=1 Tax=Chryseobacterium sp. SW-1 TaxID=3157343 RepID=UPI003B017A0B